MPDAALFRMSAFTEDQSGGNPAGVWIGDELPDEATMQRIAAEVGASETAFVAPASGPERTVRYYSPEVEVSFCGHATIATGAVLGGDAAGTVYTLATSIGDVSVTVKSVDGRTRASLTSVDTEHRSIDTGLLQEFLATLRWDIADLDDAIPPAFAYAGAWHLVIAVREKDLLKGLDYEFEALKFLMLQEGLTTLQLVWQESDSVFHSRNPFPIGGVVEDPATGAAAAAFGGYLRDSGIISAPTDFEIHQGEFMGRPSLISVTVPASGGIVVTGTAVKL
jgi:PhzF family phenazine biosynthesis protein